MNSINQNHDKKSTKRKLKLAAIVVMLCVIAGYVYFILAWKSQSDKSSEAIIRQIAAEKLDKNPNELTDEDYAAINKLDLSRKEVYDLRILAKFNNLEELNISGIPLPEPEVPKWMVVLGKFRFINSYKMYYNSYKAKYFIDLSPLEKLSNLQTLHIQATAFKDLKPLAKIENLQWINIMSGQFEEYELDEDTKKALFHSKEEYDVNGLFLNIENSPKPLIRISIPGYSEPSPIRDTEISIKRQLGMDMKYNGWNK